jgi:hypothetical protein
MPNETDIDGDIMFEHINGLTDNPPLPPVARMLPDSKKNASYGLVDLVDSLSPPPYPNSSAVDTEASPSSSAHCPPEKTSLTTPVKESSWRHKLKGAREATAGVLLQAKQAEEVGFARVKQKRLVLKDMSQIAAMREEDSRTDALRKSNHDVEKVPNDQELTQEDFSYQALYSSCDGEPSILDDNSKSGHPVRSLRTLLTAVKKVDQIRTLQSSQHGTSSGSESSAGAVGGTDISDDDVKPIEEKTIEDLMMENKRLTPETAQKKLIKDLRKHVKSLSRENLSIILERDELIGKRREELKNCKSKIRLAKKEVEERNLKLAVLEQHFCALNNSTPSFDSNQCLSFDTTASTDVDVSPVAPRDSKHFNEDDDISTNDGPVIRKSHLSSIVQVDKSYILELQSSQKKLIAELEHLKCQHSILVETSAMLEGDLRSQVEDISEKLACRERTMAGLERSIKQMREARFLKRQKSHRRRATLGNVDMTGSQKTASGDEDSSDELLNKSVSKALALKEKEHEEEITKLKESLELKNKIVKRLEGKVESLKAKSNIRSPQRRAPQAAMMRNIAVTGEMMDTSIRRLESMLKQIDQSVDNQKNVDKNDDLAPIRKVASKLSLVNDELKMSVKLIEQKHTNELESIVLKNKGSVSANANTGEPPVVTGQSSSEGEQWNSISQSSVEDAIRQAQEQASKMVQETETSIYKSLDELKDRLRDIEFDMEAKQDMIEALELACSEHVSNCRSLREELEEKKTEIESSQTPATVKSE